jgi:hypothetical protein
VSISQRSLRGERRPGRDEGVPDSGSLELDVEIQPQSVVLVELTVQ